MTTSNIARRALWISICALHVNCGGALPRDLTPETARHARRPLQFEKNQGQADPRAKYIARAGELNLFMTDDQPLVVFAAGSSRPSAVSLQLIGSGRTPAVGSKPLSGTTNYFIGHDPARWLTNVPTYSEVAYFDVYDGIDWVFHGNSSQSQLEYDFIVAPGADPHNISLRISGADSIDLTDGRQLAIEVSGRRMLMNNLSMFQSIDGEQKQVAGHYVMKGPDVIGFEIDNRYDSTRPLIIDPVLAYATYIGGISEDRGVAVAIDHHGNAYLTGSTASLNFPTQDPQQPASGGGFDAFIAKFTADGSALEYSTYFGGSGPDRGFGIAVDENGSAYACGQTGSANMPTFNALQPTYGGGVSDAFVIKLDPTGAQLLFSTFLGGSSDERALDCRLDASRALYIAGTTGSADFPTAAAVQPTFGGIRDAFLAKMDSAGSTLLFSTYLGGSGAENICALAVDLAGRAAIVGKTASLNFPVANAVQPTFGGGIGDVFVSRFDETGSSFIYSTYLGGSDDDQGFSAAVTRSGEVIAGGNSASTNYPLVNPLQSTMAGVRDLVITKLDRRGRIVFSTYLGGAANENAFGLGVDPSGNVYFAGFTASPNFPLSNPLQSTIRGPMDAIFGTISARGDALIFSTYFGGSGVDEAGFLAVDPVGNAYISGWTSSADFPATPGAFQTSFAGPLFDAFLVKLAADHPTLH
jgi:hypothetical protein